MDHYLVTFKYEGQLANGNRHDYTDTEIVSEIVTLLRAGGVAMLDWEKTHHEEIDHPADDSEPILENHTIIEVRLPIDDKPGTDDAIDWHDGGDDLFHYVVDAIELGHPEITYFYTMGEAPMQKTIIGIDIEPAF